MYYPRSQQSPAFYLTLTSIILVHSWRLLIVSSSFLRAWVVWGNHGNHVSITVYLHFMECWIFLPFCDLHCRSKQQHNQELMEIRVNSTWQTLGLVSTIDCTTTTGQNLCDWVFGRAFLKPTYEGQHVGTDYVPVHLKQKQPNRLSKQTWQPHETLLI